jgi:alpha-glucosidase
MRMDRVLAVLVAGWGLTAWAGANDKVTIQSPDGRVSLAVFISAEGRLSYSVALDETEVIRPSALGLTVDGVDLGMGPKFLLPATREMIHEEYSILGSHAKAINHANEAAITMEAAGMKFTLFGRVYNDGAAIRYGLPEGAGRIDGESTSWTLGETAGQVAWSGYSPCYEALSYVTPLEGVPAGDTVMAPVTVEGRGYYLSISEADCQDFSDMALRREGNAFKAVFPFAKEGWAIARLADNGPAVLDGQYKGQKVSPWRTTVLARNLTDLVNSNLLMNLCPAPAMDFSWVRPGRCLWQWWSIGAPKYEDQKDWYDAAAKLKWEYYLVDDGWRNWRQAEKDQWTLLEEVIAYGKSVGVQSIVWVDSKEMRQAAGRRAYLERVKAIGADGIKIDFIPDATAEIMQWYMGSLQDCAELKLLVNFHGSVKPTGLTRTYPNDITREAVRGNEFHMSRYKRVAPLELDVCLPFTRLLAGAADVTPMMLDPKELASSKFTWPHGLAQVIVCLSPVTHFADHYRFYLDSPMFDLLQEVPTAWDQTRVLECTSMGEVVGYARRKGDTWWIGVMNGAVEREVTIRLDFLQGTRRGVLIRDTMERFDAVDRSEQTVSPQTVLTVRMAPGGGFAARF